MAATEVITGRVNTEQILQTDKVADVSSQVAQLDPDKTQFTTFLEKLPKEKATGVKSEWMEDRYIPVQTTLAAAVLTGAKGDSLTITVAAGTAAYFAAGDLVRFLGSGEAGRVSSVNIGADQVTLKRGIGNAPVAAAASGSIVVIAGNQSAQGADLGTKRITKKISNYNYLEIQRHPFGFNRTEMQIAHYSGNPLSNEKQKKLVEHSYAKERMLFWGARDFGLDDEGQPIGSCGGVVEFVNTNLFDANGSLTSSALDAYLEPIFAHGEAGQKVAFVSPALAGIVAGWQRDKLALPGPDQKLFGATVNAIYVGGGGYQLPLIYKREWASLRSDSTYGASMMVVDMSNARLRELQTTILATGRQGNGIDGEDQEYLWEGTFRLSVEETHGIITHCA